MSYYAVFLHIKRQKRRFWGLFIRIYIVGAYYNQITNFK